MDKRRFYRGRFQSEAELPTMWPLDASSAYEIGTFVRVYDYKGVPLAVIARVLDIEKLAHEPGKAPIWLYTVTDNLRVWRGLPANRVGTYGGDVVMRTSAGVELIPANESTRLGVRATDRFFN